MIICAIGATEIILISAVILLMFGGKKLPELMKGMGKGVKSFKEGLNEPTEAEIDKRIDDGTQAKSQTDSNTDDAPNSNTPA